MGRMYWQAAALIWMVCGSAAIADGYRHTIMIDGANDFNPITEALLTTTTGYTAYASWDNSYLYGGYSGSKVGSDDATSWLLMHMRTEPGGTNQGMMFGTQQPTLQFSVNYMFKWRADGMYSQLYRWYGSFWGLEGAWLPSGNVATSGHFVEYRLGLGLLGNPQTMSLLSFMVNETAGAEWTWAGMPSNSFVDGYNPAFGLDSLPVDFSSSTPPNGTPEPSTVLLLGVVVAAARCCRPPTDPGRRQRRVR